jgi:hypothetical protein
MLGQQSIVETRVFEPSFSLMANSQTWFNLKIRKGRPKFCLREKRILLQTERVILGFSISQPQNQLLCPLTKLVKVPPLVLAWSSYILDKGKRKLAWLSHWPHLYRLGVF